MAERNFKKKKRKKEKKKQCPTAQKTRNADYR